jgi:hypothetical protein
VSRAAAVALALTMGLASAASADGETRPLADDVDFSKPPNEVEGYNKARITCEPVDSPEGKRFRIHGRAYYPDGVVFVVTLRHAKHVQAFSRARATVRDRTFSVDFGPYAKALPGGDLVAEAWFVLAQQPPAVATRLAEERYFSCTPPCRWDQRNATRVTVPLGGAEAQARDERAEKEQLGRALDALATALEVEGAVCLAARTGEATRAQAEVALAKLASDLPAAVAPLATWREGRQLTLFPARHGEVDALVTAMHEVGRLHATVAGVPIPGLEGGQPGFERLTREHAELQRRLEALRGFLAEEGSLDRAWREANDAAQARFNESETTTAPPTPSSGGQGRR